GTRTGRRAIIDDISGRDGVKQHAKAGPCVRQVGNAALRIVILAIEPLCQMTLGGGDVDSCADFGSSPVVFAVLAGTESHNDGFQNLGRRWNQVQRWFASTNTVLGIFGSAVRVEDAWQV